MVLYNALTGGYVYTSKQSTQRTTSEQKHINYFSRLFYWINEVYIINAFSVTSALLEL